MSLDKRINKNEKKVIEEIEKICGPLRRVNMYPYTTVENLFNFSEEGLIIMLGFDLKKLDLDANKLALLGESIKKLKHVESFLINCPKGKELPEWLKDLDFITDLIITSSGLPAIPEFIKGFKNLKKLYLGGNRIINLPEWLPTLNELEVLKLNDKKQTLDLTQSNMDILRTLSEKKVRISDPTFNLNVIHGVSLDQIRIIKKISYDDDGLNRVLCDKLNAVDEPWKAGSTSAVNVRVFDGKVLQMGINENKLEELPEDLGNLKDLTLIYIKENNITSLPESIGDLINLKELMLSANKLISLPESFVNLTSLQTLDLSNNQFKEIPTQLWALKNLTSLDLSGNPLSSEESIVIQKVPDLIREYLRKKATIKIFISHAVIDFEPYNVRDLVDYLEKQKEISEVFFCEEDLAGNIDEWMLDNVQKSQLILFIATKKSVFNSPDCANELQLADKFSIPVIPLKGDDVDWPDLAEINLSRELGLEYDKVNFDAFSESVYKYVENFKREINLMDKEKTVKGIVDIYERFRLMLDERLSDIIRRIENLEKK